MMGISNKSIKELKKQALEGLRGNWGVAILTCFAALVLTGIFSYIANVTRIYGFIVGGNYTSELSWRQLSQGTAVTALLSNMGVITDLLIGGSVTYGIYRFFLNLIRRNNPKIENLFSGFKYFGKNFLLQLIIRVFSFLWAIVVYIPAILLITIIVITGSYGSSMFDTNILSMGSNIVLVILVIIVSIGSFAVIYMITARYAMAFFILNDNENMEVMSCIEASKMLMEGHKKRYFLFSLSFIGWDILSSLTFGIGYLWLRPYKYAARASFYSDLTGEDKSNVSEVGTWQFENEFNEE